MAETRKTTKPKTKPTKKPTTKPAAKSSVKPKETKTVQTTTKTTPTKTTTATAAPKHGTSKKVLIAIIIVAIVAVVAGVVACVIGGCMKNNEIVMIENGNGDKVESKYVSLEGYNYSVLVPTSLTALTAEEISESYGTVEAPVLVYANESDTVNIAFSEPDSNLKNDEIKEYLSAMKTILGTSMDVISTDLVEKDGHNIGILKVISELNKEEIYNEMAFFSYEDKLAIITFSCRNDARGEWEKVGDAIIDSIKF